MYIDDSAKEKFSNRVLELVKNTKLSFMECVLSVSEDMGLDPTAAGKLLSKPIIEKIQKEAQDLHLLKKTKNKKLPFD